MGGDAKVMREGHIDGTLMRGIGNAESPLLRDMRAPVSIEGGVMGMGGEIDIVEGTVTGQRGMMHQGRLR